MEELASMTVGQIIGGVAGIVALLSVFIEITPIKVNPVSKFLKWIGSKTNGKILERVEEQGKKLDALDLKIDMNEVDHIRFEILNFANSCRNGCKHTKDEFDHIIELNEKYHKILDARKMTNGQIQLEYDYIIRLFKRCQEQNDFL